MVRVDNFPVRTGFVGTNFTEHTDNVQSVSFSSDDSLIVSSSDDNTVKVRDLTTLQQEVTGLDHTTQYYYRVKLEGSNL